MTSPVTIQHILDNKLQRMFKNLETQISCCWFSSGWFSTTESHVRCCRLLHDQRRFIYC